MPCPSEKYRVVQWATGVVGTVSLRAIIEHPDMDLVGVYVYSEHKEGVDAGSLCGIPPVGIKATRSITEIIALKPDCVVYMPESTDMDDVCRLLEAGINISTTRTEFYNPLGMSAAIRARVEQACRAGNSSIHASGSSPGFITEAFPIVLTSLARRLDFLMIDEFAQCLGGVVSAEMLTTFMGFGETPEQFGTRDVAARDQGFEFSLGLTAEAMGVPIERFEVTTEVAVAKHDLRMGDLVCKSGCVAGQRIVTTGFHQGKPLMCFRANWYVSADLEPAWELPADSGWKVNIQGDVPIEVTIQFPVLPEERVHAFAGLTAHRPVNAIPAICGAPQGVVTSVDLPRVIARFGKG